MTAIVPDGLLYAQEHMTCKNYNVETDTGFKYVEFPTDFSLPRQETIQNHIILLIDGECIINYNLFTGQKIKAGEMTLVPRNAIFSGIVLKSAKILIFSFDRLYNPCDTRMLESYYDLCHSIHYDFHPLAIKPPLSDFVNLMVFYLRSELKCIHLQEIKHTELFLCIRCFYTKEEVVHLLYPIMGRSLNFRELILQNSHNANNVEDLIQISNMGRTTFYERFQEEFNMSPKQWMLKQIRQRLIMKFAEPNISIKELMNLFNFESSAYFTRFCLREFHSTPLELLAKYQQNT